MDEWLKLIVLAVVQGVTEFIPVSSSGHLVLAGHLLGVASPGATLEVFLHAGTLMAIVVYYRGRLAELARGAVRRDPSAWSYCGMLALSAVPAVLIYLAFGCWLERSFDRVEIVGPALCATGVLLLLGRFGRVRTPRVGWLDTVWIGVAQALAMLPGISRSGSTISTARLRGIEPGAAAEFSLLMSVPVLAGATLLEYFRLGAYDSIPMGHLLLGAVVSGLVGYLAIILLVRLLRRGHLWWFGLYCLAVGIFATMKFTVQPMGY